MNSSRPGILLLSLVVTALGCGGGDSGSAASPTDTASSAQTPIDTAAANAAVAPLPGTGNAAPVTVADIERWQRGMVAELKAVQDAGAKLKAARNSTDSLDAVFGANDMQTLDEGAAAAGVAPERYQFIRSTLSTVVGYLTPLEEEMPTIKDMPPSMVDEMKKGREQQLQRMSTDVPADVIEALKPRASELRKQSMTLVGERLRASGAA